MTLHTLPGRRLLSGTRVGFRGLAAAALLTGLVACDKCDPSGDDDGGMVAGDVSFFSPHDGNTLTLADDVDPATAGIQVVVEVRSAGVPDGTDVTLSVDTQSGADQTAKLAGGLVRFTATLEGGPFPVGKLNRLTVSPAAPHHGASIQVTVVESTAATCAFQQPTSGARLTEDADAATAGFQTPVRVSCSGATVQPAGPVRLQVFQGAQPAGSPVLTVSQSLSNGVAAFAGITLPEGTVTLQASVLSTGTEQVGLVHISVSVDTNRCDAQITAPAASSVLTAQNATDLDPATAALDLDFAVVSALCPQGSVSLTVAGQSFSGTMTDGQGTVRVALPQGTQQVVARVEDGTGTRQPGDSPAVSYTVDTLAPCASVSAPASGQVLSATDDQETPPNAANGVTFTVHGSVDHPEGTTAVNVQVFRGTQSYVQGTAPLSAQGEFSFKVENMAAASYRVRVWATDENGNTCPPAGAPPRELPFTVTLDVPMVTVDLMDDAAPADGKLILAEDGDPDTAGMQATTQVALANADPSTGQAQVRFTPVNSSGTPTGAEDVLSLPGTLAGNGRVTLVTTLPDGFYKMSAAVTFADGRSTLATPQAIQLQVDGTPPGVVIRQPLTELRLAVTVLPLVEVEVSGEDVVPGSVTLVVNGVPSAQVATPAAGGLFDFSDVPLAGAADDHYELVVSAQDAAGNAASSAPVTVVVDTSAPVLHVLGVDRDGQSRELSVDALAPTALDISTADGLAIFDYDQDRTNGLQYGFAVETSLADCESLGAFPSVQVSVAGLADPIVVALAPVGSVCRGVATNTNQGYTLREGTGDAVATTVDTAGNAAAAHVYYRVKRADYYVAITAPADGARVSNQPQTVWVNSDYPGTGSCGLQVDGTPSGESIPLAASLTFPFTASGADGTGFGLQVVCDVSYNGVSMTLTSQLVSVTLDTVAPQNGRVVLVVGANAVALPSVFNRSVAPDNTTDGRYLKHVGVEVDADAGSCGTLAAPQLAATQDVGGTRRYQAAAGSTGVWSLAGTKCRASFRDVDFGARLEPGLTTDVAVDVTDTAGNLLRVGPVTVLNDQVAPSLTRVRPAKLLLGSADDALATTAGHQVVVEFAATSDGRPAMARLACPAPAECDTAGRTISGTQVLYGETPEDAVTVADGTANAQVAFTLSVTDQAGNASVASEGMFTVVLDVTPPVLAVDLPVENHAFGAGADADGVAPGFQVDVQASSPELDAGTAVLVRVNGALPALPLCTLAAGGTCHGLVTVPDGVVTLTVQAQDAAGNLGQSAARTVLVASSAPNPVLTGRDVSGSARALEVEVATAPQPRTLLDISVPANLPVLDYNNDLADGLQYGFLVSLDALHCATLGANPAATLEINGIAGSFAVPLVPDATGCVGHATNGGAGFALPDGLGDATVTVVDAGGNVGSQRVFYAVKHEAVTLAITSPHNGHRMRPGPLTVTAYTDAMILDGSCQLRVGGTATGAAVARATTMTFAPLDVSGVDGTTLSLDVVCTGLDGTTSSLPVQVVVDTAGPANAALVLGDGTALPAAFNLGMASEGAAASTRYLRTLAVEVDAESASCGHLTGANLNVQPAGGTAVDYPLTGQGAAQWTLVGARCRGSFGLVDLGALLEPGLDSTLQVTVADSAANTSAVGPAVVLTDRVAPSLTTVRPLRVLGPADDALAAAGFNAVVEVSFAADGRPATASVACTSGTTGVTVTCPAAALALSATDTRAVFGSTLADAITLGDGTKDVTATATVTVTDRAGNAAAQPVVVNVDVVAPVVTINKPPLNVSTFRTDADSGTPGFQIELGGNITGGKLGSALEWSLNGGAFGPLCTLPGAAPLACSAYVTVPEGGFTVQLRAQDDVGNLGVSTLRTLTVDSTPPRVASITFSNLPDSATLVGRAQDTDPAAGFQTQAVVTLASPEPGRLITLISNVPDPGHVLGSATTVGNTLSVTISNVVLAEGSHTLQATLTDAAGNANDPSQGQRLLRVDLSNPTPAFTHPNPLTDGKLLAATDLDGANGNRSGYVTTVQASTDPGEVQSCALWEASDPVNPLKTASSSLAGAVDFGLVTLAEGTRDLTVKCTDGVGNQGASAHYTPAVDSLVPQLAASPATGPFTPATDKDGNPANGITQTFSITYNTTSLDGQPNVLEPGQLISIASDLDGPLSLDTLLATGANSVSVDITFHTEGDHHVTVHARDVAGNDAFITLVLHVVTGNYNVSVQPVVGPVAGPAVDKNGNTSDGLQVDIAFTTAGGGTPAPAGSLAQLFVDGTKVTEFSLTGAGGTFINVTFSEQAAGHSYYVHVDDHVGKTGDSPTYPLLVDFTAPTVLIHAPMANAKFNKAGGTGFIQDESTDADVQGALAVEVHDCGTASHPGTLTATCAGLPLALVPRASASTPASFTDSAAGVDQTYSITLKEGLNQSLRVTCVDAANNTTSQTITVSADITDPGTVTVTASDPALDSRRALVQLAFQAPGDNGMTGTLPAGAYEVRYRTGGAVTSANWATASQVTQGIPAPLAPTTAQTVAVDNLPINNPTPPASNNVYYFGLRVTDAMGNWVLLPTAAGVDVNVKTASFYGEASGTRFGSGVSLIAGDVNHDGYDDVAVAAEYLTGPTPANLTRVGAIYVHYGQQDPQATAPNAAKVVRLRPPLAAQAASLQCGAGGGVHIIKDLNGDGFDEVAMSCSSVHNKVYVWYGQATPFTVDQAPSFIIDSGLGAVGSYFGRQVANIGDFDGDGYPDLAIGASGGACTTDAGTNGFTPRVFILYGKAGADVAARSLSGVVQLTGTGSLDSTQVSVLNGPTPIATALGNRFGCRVAPYGLLNADALADFLVAAPGMDSNGFSKNGRTYFINGTSNLRASGNKDHTVEPPSAGVSLSYRDGTRNQARLGVGLAVGNFDGADGVDVAAGAFSGVIGVAGDVSVFLIAADGTIPATPVVLAAPPIPLSSPATTDTTFAPQQVISLGDFSGDGIDDLLLGADDRGYVVFGAASLSSKSGMADFALSLGSTTPANVVVGGGARFHGGPHPDVVMTSLDDSTNGTLRVVY